VWRRRMMSTTVAIQITTTNTPRSHQNHAMRYAPSSTTRRRVETSDTRRVTPAG
jgi:hypothetical protein